MLERLNHVAIAVPHLGRAAAFYAGTLGAGVSAPQVLAEHGVRIVFVTLANAKIELLEPFGPASPIADFLVRNPQGGIHHVCYEVPDVMVARDALREAGMRVLGDGAPKLGAHGLPVLFLHPKDAFGTLIELQQTAPGEAAMSKVSDRIADLAKAHGLSEDAVRTLSDALRAGHGGAQWSHPDLGGMGQWSAGGMLQIGNMFDEGLKVKVAAVLAHLSATGRFAALDPVPPEQTNDAAAWWPRHLGSPASTGSQNAMRYACFPEQRRIAVERDGAVVLYDTGHHRLTGVAQAQGAGQTLSFTGSEGNVELDALDRIDR